MYEFLQQGCTCASSGVQYVGELPSTGGYRQVACWGCGHSVLIIKSINK